MNVATPPHGILERASATNRAHLSRLAGRGKAIRLAPGLYAVGATLPPEQVANQHLYEIVASVVPGGVLCGRTALAGGRPSSGELFVASPDPPRRSPLRLPGVVIVPVIGPERLPGDMPMPAGLFVSGPARALVENVHLRGRPPRHRAGTDVVEDRIDDLARTGGAGRILTVLAQLDVIASSFAPEAVGAVRNRLTAVLGSVTSPVTPTSHRLAARLAGTPYDAHRITMLAALVEVLQSRAPTPRPTLGPSTRWEWLPFFEAYFSNYIEGTEFGVDEARRIAVDGLVSTERPEDAHDVAATYRLAVDPVERRRVPATSDQLLDALCERHAVLMAARPDKQPGKFKTVANYAGGYPFVSPELVEGTLRRGFDQLNPLVDPFARAVAMMLLITECHPFVDGNGRVARLAANAELSAAGQVRFIIPTVYRTNYLVALNAISNGADPGHSITAVLDFAQRWTTAINWTNFQDADTQMRASNAYTDPGIADAAGLRLTLPGTIAP